MNCKRIRDLIITDYIDKEASEAVQEEIRVHIEVCAGCRAFEQSLREKVSDPLRKMETVTPPESVWQRVREAIDNEEAVRDAPSLLERVSDFLAGAILSHKPGVALSASLVVIFVAAFFVQVSLFRQGTVKDYLREQSDVMQSMSSPVNGELEKDIGFGTSIENVFFRELY